MFFMKKGIWKTRKLLGFIMSLIMIFSLMPGSLSYAEGEKTILTDIEELKELKVQSIEQGTLPDELELPTELKASGYLESGSAEETAEMTVKVKKWQVRLKESVDKEEEGEWKDYKETTEPGVYYFRPVLDETYQLAEGVELPMYALEVSAAEAQTEVVTEAQTEAQTEVVTEAQTEAQTEVVTEAQTEAQTEVVTEDRSADGSDNGSTDRSANGSGNGGTDRSADGSDNGGADRSADGSGNGGADRSADGSDNGSTDRSADGSDNGGADRSADGSGNGGADRRADRSSHPDCLRRPSS